MKIEVLDYETDGNGYDVSIRLHNTFLTTISVKHLESGSIKEAADKAFNDLKIKNIERLNKELSIIPTYAEETTKIL